VSEPAALDEPDRRFVDALRAIAPGLAMAADQIADFAKMVRTKAAATLEGWLRAAEDGPLASFAAGLRRDEDAVRAALSLPWSNGPVEGQVNRLKVIKRDMYGSAGFDLLRRRILGRA
jgi:transposase